MARHKMILELADYSFIENSDGTAEIRIMNISNRFKDLWATKMAELYTDDEEIAKYETID